MKPTEYVKKYDLLNSKDFDNNAFVRDLLLDFKRSIELREKSGGINQAKFKLCVKDLRSKFDSIRNKTAHPKINDKMWNYMYATCIGPMKEELFKEELRAERERKLNKEKLREQRERSRRNRERAINAQFFQSMFSEAFKIFNSEELFGATNNSRVLKLPREAMNFLKLDEFNLTEENVNRQYRRLSFLYHPDHGGSGEEFNKLKESKKLCLAYIEMAKMA